MVCYQRVGVILLFVMNTRNYFFFHPGLIGSRVQDLKVDIYLTTSMITNRFIDFVGGGREGIPGASSGFGKDAHRWRSTASGGVAT